MTDFQFRSRYWLSIDEPDLDTIEAFFNKEILTFQILMGHFKSRKSDVKIMLVLGAIMIPLCVILSITVFDSFYPFPPFFFPVFIVPVLVLYARHKFWENKVVEPDEVFNNQKMEY